MHISFDSVQTHGLLSTCTINMMNVDAFVWKCDFNRRKDELDTVPKETLEAHVEIIDQIALSRKIDGPYVLT